MFSLNDFFSYFCFEYIFPQEYAERIHNKLKKETFVYGIVTMETISAEDQTPDLCHMWTQVSKVYIHNKHPIGMVFGKILPCGEKCQSLKDIGYEKWNNQTGIWMPLQPLCTASSNGKNRSSIMINGTFTRLHKPNKWLATSFCNNETCQFPQCKEMWLKPSGTFRFALLTYIRYI